ncbi:MAG: hypothetical protein DMD87_13950 [Candidatus Rokuibacteriota bacterium]|nr:MAG: hypothetical protein DMD87_13950 [Candidatus Rokubacteria bacterium]
MADPATGMLGPLPQSVVLPFKGTFRMPFAIDAHARHVRSDRQHAAFYLADDLRTLELVRPTELSVGDVRPLASTSAPSPRFDREPSAPVLVPIPAFG